MNNNLIAVFVGSIARGFSVLSLHAEPATADAAVRTLVAGGYLAEAVSVQAPEGGAAEIAGEQLVLLVLHGKVSSGFRLVGPFVDVEGADRHAASVSQGDELGEIFICGTPRAVA